MTFADHWNRMVEESPQFVDGRTLISMSEFRHYLERIYWAGREDGQNQNKQNQTIAPDFIESFLQGFSDKI